MSTSTTITGMPALGGAPAANDLLVTVDVSDSSEAPAGTTKNMTVANLLTSPSIASPSITGTATVAIVNASGLVSAAGGVKITGSAAGAAGAIYKDAAQGLVITGIPGSSTDVLLTTTTGNIFSVPTGTTGFKGAGAFSCNGATPQTKATIGNAATDLATVIALANNIRTALNANGITQT